MVNINDALFKDINNLHLYGKVFGSPGVATKARIFSGAPFVGINTVRNLQNKHQIAQMMKSGMVNTAGLRMLPAGRGKPLVDRVLRNVLSTRSRGLFNFNTMAKVIGKYPGWAAVSIGLVAGGINIGRQMYRTVNFKPPERPSALRAGPGYISWGKTAGMPANHLSTDGLSLALSKMRHTSTI